MTRRVVEASMAVALGAKLCKPKVIPMYPITPQTHIVEELANFINNGELNAKMIDVESEHSAMSAITGAAAVGVRTFTATSSQGLALMFEILPIQAGLRLPTVMAVATRALSAPINIWGDHSDAVSCRDQGWIMLFAESGQEALDAVIQAYKISENHDVMLPAMVCIDGFTLSHVYEPIDEPLQKDVDAFLPEFKPLHVLDVKNPKSFGPISYPDTFMLFKQQQQEAMENAKELIEKTNNEFNKKFGRSYGNGLLELHEMEDAEFAIIAMGTVCGTARTVVNKMRRQGKKVGLIKLRSLRPFPRQQLQDAAKNLNALAVIDRHISLGNEGALASDVRSAIYCNDIQILNYIAGLGGRDITTAHIEKVFNDLMQGKPRGEWLL